MCVKNLEGNEQCLQPPIPAAAAGKKEVTISRRSRMIVLMGLRRRKRAQSYRAARKKQALSFPSLALHDVTFSFWLKVHLFSALIYSHFRKSQRYVTGDAFSAAVMLH